MSNIIGIDVSFGKCTIAVFQNGKPGIVGSFAADEYTPEVFAAAKNLASAVLATPITKAVVAVPAIRSSQFIGRIYARARKADLEVIRALYKTSAIAMAYGFTNNNCKTICTLCNYSKGGFDFSVTYADDGMFETKSICGGNDGSIWSDKMLISKIKTEIKASEVSTKNGAALIFGECTQDVHNALAETFPVEVVRQEMVALGAAIQGAVLSGDSDVKDIMLLEAIATGLGVEVGNRNCHFIVKRNELYPLHKTIKIKKTDEDADNFIVHIVKGNSEKAKNNETYATLDCCCDYFESDYFKLALDIDASGTLNLEIQRDDGTPVTSLNNYRI